MKLLLGRAAWWLPSVAWAVIGGCSIYDTSLLGTTGSGANGPQGGGGTGGVPVTTSTNAGAGGTGGIASSSTGGAQSGGGGTGGMVACSAPGDCPGMDTTCHTRTCDAHVCGATNAPKKTTCTEVTNGVCDGSGQCVECVDADQCTDSHICGADHTCTASTCMDGVKNQDESDKDCGGSCPDKCDPDKHCNAPADCKGGVCTAGTCAATCSDGIKDQDESDKDCGGATCPKCVDGSTCNLPGDCVSGICNGGFCSFRMVISEVKTRGAAGGSDEYVEIYNPTSAEIVLDALWAIEVRSYSSGTYTKKAFGTGVHIPSHHHYLLSGSAYPGGSVCTTCPLTPCGGVACADFTQLPGIKDAASVALLHNDVVIDAVCFSYDQPTHDAIANGSGYACEGAVVSNLPHNDGTTGGSNTDVSLERKPGGAAGNGTDTNDNTADFTPGVAQSPQNLASPATP